MLHDLPTSLASDRAWIALAGAARDGHAPHGEALLGLGCCRFPEELPLALGLRPRRVRPLAEPPVRATPLLQGFACSFLQGLLHQGLGEELSDLRGLTLAASTCDSMRALPAIWRSSGARPQRLFSLRMPASLEGAAARELLDAELRRWIVWLEELAGTPLDAARLRETVRLANRRRAALRGLRSLAERGALPCSLLELAEEGACSLPETEATALLEAALASAPTAPGDAAGPRLALLGGLLDRAPLLAWLEAHGALVVHDETCPGRVIDEERDLDEERPLADISRRMLRTLRCCPTAVGSAQRRLEQLRDPTTRLHLDGALLLRGRGCEMHAFDSVLLGRGLEQAGLPHLALELTPGEEISGQVGTRLEAFLEMLSGLPLE